MLRKSSHDPKSASPRRALHGKRPSPIAVPLSHGPFHRDLSQHEMAQPHDLEPLTSACWILGIQLLGLEWLAGGSIPHSLLLCFLDRCSKTWKARDRHALEKPCIQSMGCKRKPLYHYVGKQKKKHLKVFFHFPWTEKSNSLCLQAPFNSVR